MKRLYCITLAVILLLTSCGPRSGGPSAWIDQPIDRSRFPLQPIQITAHASAPAGITGFEFFIDGVSIGEVAVGGGRLELAEMIWEPQAPGIYLVSVAATDG
ncbi:MAG: Ig-like domain-containing protein, partial [Anaerolineales bacterium]